MRSCLGGIIVKSTAEIYLDTLTERFGREDTIKRIEATDNGPAIHVFYYYDLPEKGCLTSITYGLSIVDFPEWKYGRPELIVSLDTQDESWGLASAYFASQFRGAKRFSYGDLFTTDSPISEESEMAGYFLFTPSFLSKEEYTIELPDYKVFLSGMYPLYKEEVNLYNKIGLKDFWHLDGFDMYNVNRINLAKEK